MVAIIRVPVLALQNLLKSWRCLRGCFNLWKGLMQKTQTCAIERINLLLVRQRSVSAKGPSMIENLKSANANLKVPQYHSLNSLRFRYLQMMCREVQNCASTRPNILWCRLSSDCRGWGCRHLRVFPDTLPVTEHDRGKLFSKVYAEAEKRGILECPHFVPTLIDDVVESETELLSIMRHKTP